MGKFTPGPWDHDSGMYGNGKQYHSIYAPADAVVIAEFNAMPEFNPEQGEANANLIAAAPEMYAALSTIMELIDTGRLVRDISDDLNPGWAIKQMDLVLKLKNAQTALAKAEGKEGK